MVRFRAYENGSVTLDTEIDLAEAARNVAALTERTGSRPTVDAGYTYGVKFVYPTLKAYVNGTTLAELRAAYLPVIERHCETVGCGNAVEGTARFCGECSEALVEAEVEDAEPVAMVLADGTYTLVYGNGEYFTFRVRTVRNGRLAGRRVAEFLSGPDNSLDFQPFAFVNENSLNVWRRFERGRMVNRAREIEAMSRNDREGLEAAGLRYAERSSRCRRCNKVLTVPASLASGFGPDCAAILGVAYGGAEETSARRSRRTEETVAEPTANEFAEMTTEELDETIGRAEMSDGRQSHHETRAWLRRATAELNRRRSLIETDCPRCGDPLTVCTCERVQTPLAAMPTASARFL